jgi:hypothetical protein
MTHNRKAWTLFVKRHIEPTIFDRKPLSYNQLAAELGYADAKQAGAAVVNVIRTLNHRWREVLAEQRSLFEGEPDREVRRSFGAARFIDFRRLFVAIAAGDDVATGQCTLAPDQLSQLVDLANDQFAALVDAEKAILFESYLLTPLKQLLGDATVPPRLRDISFAQMLEESTTDPAELQVLSRLLESRARDSASTLPRAVAMLLRLATVLLARERHGTEISSLDADTLNRATQEALTNTWLDQRLRSLLTRSANALRNVPEQGDQA